MGESDHNNKTINGSQVVYSQPGRWTGDRVYHTADGRAWEALRGGIPNTVPTGAVIGIIRDQRR